MLIIGAKGFAKEVLEICHQCHDLKDLVFYDDINLDIGSHLFNQFKILKNINEAKHYFETVDSRFTIGIGNPELREKIYKKFSKIGGDYSRTISPNAKIGSYDVEIGNGTNILSNAIISNSAKIGKGCILYYNVIVTHDCIVGDFVELSPNATLLGRVDVGNFSQIGANATILPNLKIGKNVVVGAGAVVTKDLPDNCCAVGIPAKIIKEYKIIY